MYPSVKHFQEMIGFEFLQFPVPKFKVTTEGESEALKAFLFSANQLSLALNAYHSLQVYQKGIAKYSILIEFPEVEIKNKLINLNFTQQF